MSIRSVSLRHLPNSGFSHSLHSIAFRKHRGRGKRIDDAAIRNPATQALPDQCVQLATQCLKIGDFAIHFVKMFARDDINGFT